MLTMTRLRNSGQQRLFFNIFFLLNNLLPLNIGGRILTSVTSFYFFYLFIQDVTRMHDASNTKNQIKKRIDLVTCVFTM